MSAPMLMAMRAVSINAQTHVSRKSNRSRGILGLLPPPLWGRAGEGGGCCRVRRVRQLLPPPPTPPHKGRAIAYGKVAPILHLAGWIGSERQLSRSALDSVLFWVRFGGRVSTARRLALDPGEYNKGKTICDSPTHKGEGNTPSAQQLSLHQTNGTRGRPSLHGHSITSSASASIDGGTARPSGFAALRLITISNSAAWVTGRSDGFSPLRMRAT
jgi:hypothetical protein